MLQSLLTCRAKSVSRASDSDALQRTKSPFSEVILSRACAWASIKSSIVYRNNLCDFFSRSFIECIFMFGFLFGLLLSCCASVLN